MKKCVLKNVHFWTRLLTVTTILTSTFVAPVATVFAEDQEPTVTSTVQTETPVETTAQTEEKTTETKVSEPNISQKEATFAQEENNDTTQKLTILGTSDVHGQLWNWSYEDDVEKAVGLSQVSTVVKNTRAENAAGTILIDNGDLNQGTILTDDLYNRDLQNEPNPMIKALNYMNYDAMVLGNHEFNFGIPLIKKLESEANFPILAANIYDRESGSRFVKGTTIKEIDFDGEQLKVGIIGLTTPQVPLWDGDKVASLEFNALQSEAEKAVAELDGQADIIVASIHAGRENTDPTASANSVIQNVAGIDAYILGHDHLSFATKATGPDGKEVPVAGPKDTGTELVRIDLEVAKNDEQWEVKKSDAQIVSTTNVAADEELKALTKTYHDRTRDFISEKIGTATESFLPVTRIKGIPEAQMQPTAMISLINNVQMKAMNTQLSAAALFKADSKFEAGDITYSKIFDIYKYPNTLVKTEITGEKLLAYLEKQATYYQTPQPDDLTVSFNEEIRVYNYDMVSGVNYKIDISKPIGQRIVNATIDSQPVDLTATYTLAVNNYRFEGMQADGFITGAPLDESDPETVRGLIAEYIRDKGTLDPEQEIERNWELIGYDFDAEWEALAIRLINDGTLTIQDVAGGRTPNVKAITKQDVRDAGYDLDSEKVTIMHTNDVHGRFEGNGKDVLGSARLKTYKEQVQPDLLLDAGDSFQGLPVSNFSEGDDMAKIMNAVGYDAMAVGNHEFDFGLEKAIEYKDLLDFPILSNNTYKDGELVFEPYKVINKNGKNYAVIGVTTPETATKTHPKNIVGVTFADPIAQTKKTIQEIQAGDVAIDVYVVLGHLGIDETTPHEWRGDTLAEAMSQAFPTLNLVMIDGHSHTEVNGGKQYNNVMYTQTGNYLNNVGLLSISLTDLKDKKASLTSARDLAQLEENDVVKALVSEARQKFEAWGAEEIIPYNPHQFNGERDNVRTRETNLGNLIGDAMLAYGQTGFQNPSDFAVTNGGGIRANIETGPVTLGDVIAVLPFGNSISQIKVSGQQVREMFELSIRSMAQTDADGNVLLDDFGQPKLGANGGFLHVSSTIQLYYDSTKQGSLLPNDEGNGTDKTKVGERVLGIYIQNRETGKFEPLSDEQTYYMATNDFLAAGGDGYDMLGGEREEGPSLDDVLISYLRQAATTRAYVASTNVDLAQYAEPFPNQRVISMSEAAYNEKFGDSTGDSGNANSSDSTDSTNSTQDTDNTTDSTTGSNQPTNPAAGGNGTTGTKGSGKDLPKTGSDASSLQLLGCTVLSATLAGAAYVVLKRKKVA